MIEIACNFRANIHISKYYFTKYKGKNLKYFGNQFMCEIISSHKHSFTDDLQSISYYIIYTLTRIENVLIYVAHAYMHWPWGTSHGWTIYYFIKTIFRIWIKNWSGKFSRWYIKYIRLQPILLGDHTCRLYSYHFAKK